MLEDYTQEQFEYAYQEIYKNIIRNKEKKIFPKAYILGGQPGSGKSTLYDIINNKTQDYIAINGDEYRGYHPSYKEILKEYGIDAADHTQKFANQITENLIKKLSNEKYNLIIEGTLRTAEIPLTTCKMLKEKGYEVELSVIGVNPEISWRSTMLRYQDMKKQNMMPRATTKLNHDRVVNDIRSNLEKIYLTEDFDNITIYQRDHNCIYNQKITPEVNPGAVLDCILNYEKGNIDVLQQMYYYDSMIKNIGNEELKKLKKGAFYENSDIPINKLNIRDGVMLKEIEKDILAHKILGVDSLYNDSKLDFDHLKNIHKFMYDDLYYLAGECRGTEVHLPEDVLNECYIEFAQPGEIESIAKKTIMEFEGKDLAVLNINEKATEFSKMIADLWKAQPFQYGNTQSIIIYTAHVAEKREIPLEKECFKGNDEYLEKSLIKACDKIFPDNNHLTLIVKDALDLGEDISISEEIKHAGFRPTDVLISDMKKFNERFHKQHSIKEVKNIYENMDQLSDDDQKIVKEVVNDFVDEEKKDLLRTRRESSYDLER